MSISPLTVVLLALALAGTAGAVPALAHEPMAHGCVAPTRPDDDQNDVLWAAFLEEIDVFQSCITAAADRHQAASEAHQRAAFAAVDAWNDFVRTSLNAPEDFPWPPEDD
jgi:hypothetical protein